jgi:outer membrane protein, multidrug efflux system
MTMTTLMLQESDMTIQIAPQPVRPALRLLPLALAVVFAGCANLAPDYQRPDAPVPAHWPQGQSYTATTTTTATTTAAITDEHNRPAADLPWQSFILDEHLRQVIQLALDNNRNLRATLADVAAARATYKGQAAAEYPQMDASLSGSRARSANGSGGATTANSTQATVGMSAYEIDLFGKASNLTAMDREAWLSSAETARAAQITLISETANAWLTLASDQHLLALAQETASNAQKAMDITYKRLSLGVDSRVDLSSAETTYHSARADIARYTTQVAQDKNALWLLAGHDLDASLLPDQLPDSQQLLTPVAAGVSSEVLLQRPDVMAAEHNLKSANANIGVARAAWFPSLSLTAAGGVASSALADLFSGGATTIWSIAPSLSLPIFTAGGTDADVEYAKAGQQKSLATYEYTVQTAFREVADVLARHGTLQEQLNAETDLVSSAQRSYDLSLARYKLGVDSFQDTLTSQRTLYSAQQSLISTRLTDLSNRINLYRVLGGGFGNEGVDEGMAAEDSAGQHSTEKGTAGKNSVSKDS